MQSCSLSRKGRRVAAMGLLLSVVALCACAPALDWREIRPEGSDLLALLPCKPANEVREVALAGEPVRMTMHACAADGAMYAVAFADVADPTRVGPALAQMQASVAANLAATSVPAPAAPLKVPGMTPHPQARRLTVSGHYPDGKPVSQEAVFFSYGTRVYQASVLGSRLRAEAVAVFFDGLKVNP